MGTVFLIVAGEYIVLSIVTFVLIYILKSTLRSFADCEIDITNFQKILAFTFIFILLLIPVSSRYSLIIYPLINPAIGGGSGIKVQILTNSYDRVSELVPFEAESKNKILPSCLLEQNSQYYFLVVPKNSDIDLGDCVPPYSFRIQNNTDVQVIQINRDLISATLYILN